jgi:hypothetical protein
LGLTLARVALPFPQLAVENLHRSMLVSVQWKQMGCVAFVFLVDDFAQWDACKNTVLHIHPRLAAASFQQLVVVPPSIKQSDWS